MQLDRKALNRLLSLNDRQLQAVINTLVTEYGFDLTRFQVREGDMDALRQAIRNASDADLEELKRQIPKGRS
ncbi:MAG: hypothetical protein IJY50_00400 [Clostridia bacterium]|nr:hypothetical protein [Clostridia bacterium]